MSPNTSPFYAFIVTAEKAESRGGVLHGLGNGSRDVNCRVAAVVAQVGFLAGLCQISRVSGTMPKFKLIAPGEIWSRVESCSEVDLDSPNSVHSKGTIFSVRRSLKVEGER